MRYFLLILATILLLPAPVYAHVLRTDGNIGIVLHINPEDDPYVGQPANLFFDITDKTNRFQPQLCNCQLTISANNQNLLSQPLTSDLTANFTFPSPDVYHITVTGQPNTTNAFQPFNISWDWRVSRLAPTSNNPTNANNLSKWLGGAIILLAVTTFAIYRWRSRSR